MFYRKYRDPGEEWEEVPEVSVVASLATNFMDVGSVVDAMKNGELAHTCFAVYTWSENGTPNG